MIALVVLVGLQFQNSVFAIIASGTVKVPVNCVMVQAEDDVKRGTSYSYVMVKANAVYPTGSYSTDNFTKCRVRLYHPTVAGCPITDVTVLQEGSGYFQLKLYEGFYDLAKFDLYFSGNNVKYAAYVSYTYNSR